MNGGGGYKVVKGALVILIHGDKREGLANKSGLTKSRKVLTSLKLRERIFSATQSACLESLYRPIPTCPMEGLSMCCLSGVVLRSEPSMTCPYR